MCTTCIRIAGLTVEIRHLNRIALRGAAGFLCPEGQPDFSVEVTQPDIDDERERCFREEGEQALSYGAAALERTAIYRKIAQILPRYDAFVMHGAVVALDGNGYLFTAKSGTGKTTHANLWLKNIPGSFILDGDKPIVRLQNGIAYVCGTPWNGKERQGTADCLPLKGIALLYRDGENTVSPIRFASAAPTLIRQTYRPEDRAALAKTLSLLSAVGEKTPLYELKCNMKDAAAIVAHAGMVYGKF